MILGTAAYMSPEQARAKSVDKRTDVWAFGAVLYEMLSGRRAFEGDDVTELIAAVVKTTPDWSAIPADVPPHIVTLIQRCLDKDRKTRIGDIAVARFLLSSDAVTSARSSAVEPVATGRWRGVLPWVAAALVAGVGAGWVLPRQTSPVSTIVTHAQVGLSPAEYLAPAPSEVVRPSRTAFALSPDGRVMAFTGVRGNTAQLYVRALDRPDATAIAGSDGAVAPFFSPDGQWIAFAADGKIKKVPAAGGATSTICDIAGQFLGAGWGDDDTIFFAARDGIFKVPAGGGAPVGVTKPDAAKGERHLLPRPLPGSQALSVHRPAEHRPPVARERRAAIAGRRRRRALPVDRTPAIHSIDDADGGALRPSKWSAHRLAGGDDRERHAGRERR